MGFDEEVDDIVGPTIGQKVKHEIFGDVYEELDEVFSNPITEEAAEVRVLLGVPKVPEVPGAWTIRVLQMFLSKLVKMYSPALAKGIKLIKETVSGGIENTINSQFKSYPNLKDIISALIKEQIQEKTDELNKSLKTYMEAQNGFVNLKHTDMLELNSEKTCWIIGTYMKTMHTSVQDTFAKYIMKYLVLDVIIYVKSDLKDDVDRELGMKKISKDEAVDDEDTKENILQVGELEKVKEGTKMAIETLKQI